MVRAQQSNAWAVLAIHLAICDSGLCPWVRTWPPPGWGVSLPLTAQQPLEKMGQVWGTWDTTFQEREKERARVVGGWGTETEIEKEFPLGWNQGTDLS